jgi:DNA-binding response OmpR family regulator
MGGEMKNFNILIVEDEALVALEMKHSIEEMGFCVLDYATTSIDGQALRFTTIEEVIWENEPTSNNAIRTLIYRLRGKINHKLIEKVFGYGIRLS